MKEPYISVTGAAQAQSAGGAFCIQSCGYVLDMVEHKHEGDMWIPMSVIMEDSHDVIEEAVRGDVVEIFVAKWWLEKL